MAPHSRRTPVLILARDPVLAALIGVALGLGDLDPVFAEPGERPEDAIARLLPPIVVLLDGELEAASSDLFFARATRRGARVVLFAAPGAGERAAALAVERGLPFVAMPASDAELRAALAAIGDPRGDSRGDPRGD